MSVSYFTSRRKSFTQIRIPDNTILVLTPESTQETELHINCTHCHLQFNHVCVKNKHMLKCLYLPLVLSMPAQSSGDEKCSLMVPNHMPIVEEACDLGLGRVEYNSVINSIGEVSDPIPSKKQKVVRGKYAVYSAEDQQAKKLENMPWKVGMKRLVCTSSRNFQIYVKVW